MHGNEILAGYDPRYDQAARFHQADHSLPNIALAIRGIFRNPADSLAVLTQLAGYIVLDALIGNVDRHHENWALLWQVIVEHDDFRETARLRKEYVVAPSYDHASSLGRELLDEKRIRLLNSAAVETYVRKGHGGIFKVGEKRGENPLRLVESAAADCPEYFQRPLESLRATSQEALTATLDRVPAERISQPAREFARSMLNVAYKALTRIGQ